MHLYTMRTPLATDFRGPLERLAEIGYATVGVSGRHGHGAADIRRMLDEARLRAVLEHVAYDIVKGAGLPQALEDIHTLGGKWIVVPSLPGSLHSPAGYREVAREFNRAGLAARESGLKLLYHNHGTDHQVVDGVSLYDVLLTETDPDLVGFELDLYWAADGGARGTLRTPPSALPGAPCEGHGTQRGLRRRRFGGAGLSGDVRHGAAKRCEAVAGGARRAD